MICGQLASAMPNMYNSRMPIDAYFCDLAPFYQ